MRNGSSLQNYRIYADVAEGSPNTPTADHQRCLAGTKVTEIQVSEQLIQRCYSTVHWAGMLHYITYKFLRIEDTRADRD